MDLKKAKSSAFDCAVVIGAGFFVYGLGLAWRPLWFIAGGLILAGAAFLVGYEQRRGAR